MKLSLLLDLALLSIAPVLSGPVHTYGSHAPGNLAAEAAPLLKRQTSNVNCAGFIYDADYLHLSYQLATGLSENGQTYQRPGGDPFPHEFRNDEAFNFPECPGVPEPYLEFPILRGETGLFTPSNDPGSDRIVYRATAFNPANGLPDNFVYCGAITHTGASRPGGFVQCPPV